MRKTRKTAAFLAAAATGRGAAGPPAAPMLPVAPRFAVSYGNSPA